MRKKLSLYRGGEKYEGRIYVMSGVANVAETGLVCTSEFIDNKGNCLIPLKTYRGDELRMPEYKGKNGHCHAGYLTIDEEWKQ